MNAPGSNDGNVTVMGGANDSTTTLTDPYAFARQAVAVDETTNKTYLVIPNDSALSAGGGMAIINGATNALTFVKSANAIYPQPGR